MKSRNTEISLQARPPDLIVVANYISNASKGHPVYQWISSNYRALPPVIPGERRFFTFYVPVESREEFIQRVLGPDDKTLTRARDTTNAGQFLATTVSSIK